MKAGRGGHTLELGRAAAWAIGLTGLLALAPTPAEAIKKTPPLTMTAAFEHARPALNRAEPLRITLETTRAYTNLRVRVTLPPEIALASGRLEWRGALAPESPRTWTLQVMLRKPGRYSVAVDATFDPGESEFESARIFLNVIAEPGEAAASMAPFEVMDLERAGTGAALERMSCSDGIVIPTPPLPAKPDMLPELLGPDTPPAPPASSLTPGGEPEATVSVTVRGTMRYKDTAGGVHPIRLAVVKVFDIDSGGVEQLMGQGSTAKDGTYTIRARGGDAANGPDIRVKVFAAIRNNAVVGVGPTLTSFYVMQSPIYTNFSGGSLNVSLTTGRPVRGSATDHVGARAFSVLDAILQAAAEAYALRGNRLMGKIPVLYPVAGTVSFYDDSPVSLNILRQDALDWDVLFHEYGHYLADRGSSALIDTSMGGRHSGGSCIPRHGKNKGVRLAWSEGLATWFAIMAQIEPSQTTLPLPGIPLTRDRFWQDTEDSTITDDLESIGNGSLYGEGQGYASENSVEAMLYDLCDANRDKSSDGTSVDIVNSTPKTVWNIINQGPNDNVAKFHNALFAASGRNSATLVKYTPTFAMNNISPEVSAPKEGAVVSSVVSPTFKWIANGDPTAGYPHNLFALIVAKNDFKTIVGIKANIRATEYTFTDAEWAGITVQADRTGRFQWAVAARNTTVFSLPGAGQIPFVSNPRGFRLRAYHLRLTWTTFGADVDLHFIPPNGATCSFRNRSPDWGVAGDPSDNPTLDRDCITSCTEENITVDKLTAPGTYRVAVHYYYDHDRGGTTATVEILQYGYRVAAIQRYLGRTGAYSTVFNVTVSAAGDCVFEESGDAPLEGVTVAPGFQKAEPADD